MVFWTCRAWQLVEILNALANGFCCCWSFFSVFSLISSACVTQQRVLNLRQSDPNFEILNALANGFFAVFGFNFCLFLLTLWTAKCVLPPPPPPHQTPPIPPPPPPDHSLWKAKCTLHPPLTTQQHVLTPSWHLTAFTHTQRKRWVSRAPLAATTNFTHRLLCLSGATSSPPQQKPEWKAVSGMKSMETKRWGRERGNSMHCVSVWKSEMNQILREASVFRMMSCVCCHQI